MEMRLTFISVFDPCSLTLLNEMDYTHGATASSEYLGKALKLAFSQ